MRYSKGVAKKRSLNKTTTQKPYWPKYHDSWSMSLCPRKNGWKTRYISWFQDMKCRYQTPGARDAKKQISNLKVCIYYSYCMFYTVVHVTVDLERKGFWLRFSRKRNFSWKLTHESAICLFRLNFKQRLVWLIRNLQWPSVWVWSNIIWINIRSLEVSFEIQPKEAITQNSRENLPFRLNFKPNPFVWRSASTCTNKNLYFFSK